MLAPAPAPSWRTATGRFYMRACNLYLRQIPSLSRSLEFRQTPETLPYERIGHEKDLWKDSKSRLRRPPQKVTGDPSVRDAELNRRTLTTLSGGPHEGAGNRRWSIAKAVDDRYRVIRANRFGGCRRDWTHPYIHVGANRVHLLMHHGSPTPTTTHIKRLGHSKRSPPFCASQMPSPWGVRARRRASGAGAAPESDGNESSNCAQDSSQREAHGIAPGGHDGAEADGGQAHP